MLLLIFVHTELFTSRSLFTVCLDSISNQYAVISRCNMLKILIIYAVLACVSAPYQYSLDEKINCVVEYYRNEESMIKTQRSLQRKYGFRPSDHTICRLVDNFLTYGDVQNPEIFHPCQNELPQKMINISRQHKIHASFTIILVVL
jgi:hypothetical protein